MPRRGKAVAFNAANSVKTFTTAVAFLLLLAAPAVRAQAPTDNSAPLGMAPGAPEGGYALSGFENVNLYNGSLSFSYPLMQVGGRGGAGYTAHVPIDAKWMVTRNEWLDQNDTPQFALVPTYSNGVNGIGAGYGPGVVSIKYNQWKPEGCFIGAQYFTTYRWASVSILFTAPDGTQHELVDQGTRGQPTSYPSCSLNGTFRGPVFVSKDENGMTFISDGAIREAPYWANARLTGYLKMPDGTVYRVDSYDYITQWASYYTPYISWIRDPNGNKTTFGYSSNGYGLQLTSIKDSLNRKITIEYGLNLGTYGSCDRLTYTGFGGAERKVHVSYGNLGSALRSGSLETLKQLFPQLDGDDAESFDPTVVTSIWLPDGDGVTRRYQFKYNKYGELARVELPTGGAINYDWGAGLANGAANGLIQPVPNVAHVTETVSIPQIYRRLHGRHAYDAGGVLLGSTGYGRPETQNGDNTISNVGYVSVGHFDENDQQVSAELHYFYGSPATSFFTWGATPQYMPTYSPFPSYREGREYQADYLAANGSTLLRRVAQSWDQPALFWWYGSADAAPANCPFVKETVTTLADTGQTTKTTNVNPQTGQIMIDQFGNPIDVWVYDYGGGLLRRMHTEFLTVNPVNGVDYTNRTSASGPHRVNLPTQMSIYDSNDVERARTTIEYDNYSGAAGHAPLVDRVNISGFDPTYNFNYTARGNATATTRYFLTNGSVTGSITGYVQYDIAGNTVKTIDARGNPTMLDYADHFGAPDGEVHANSSAAELTTPGQTSYAFPTQVTNALGHISYTQYDYYTGKAVDAEDPNGTTYSGYYNDALDRPKQMISGSNRAASLKSRSLFEYDDVNRVTTRTNDFNSFAEAAPLKTQTLYDGMGRTTETRRYEGGGSYITLRQRYDALGRISKTSNPFRNGETPVWTTTIYDELSRVSSVTTPDNSVLSTSYYGNSATVTDQVGKKQKSVSDALGRLTDVYEDPDGANWLTSYSYDALDNLTGASQYDPVSQVTQARTFNYDSLKRLTSAMNPENGTVNYSYDEQGNILVRKDARGVSSHASYDALNRVTRRWYNGSDSITATVNNSPALPAGVTITDQVDYYYDAQALPAGSPPGFARGSATGQLVAVTYGGGSAGDYFSFDAMGRVTLKVQQTGGVNYQTSAVYNNGGGRKTLTYPSGHIVNYNYDAAGRPGDKDAQNLAVTGNLGDSVARTYSAGIAYSPFGGISQEQYGTQTPVYNKSIYNVRGQRTEIRVGTTPNDTFWNRGAIINHYSDQSWAGSGPDNNGNLRKQDVYIPDDDQITGHSLTTFFYSYDGVNRLDRMREVRGGTESFVQDYDLDRFGNRKINAANTWGVGETQYTVSPTNNRLGVPGGYVGAMSYDAAGNLTEDTYTMAGQGQRKYDAWSRMTQAWANNQWQTYTYDGNGRRVRRNVYGQETWQVYGIAGELLAEYAANALPTQPQKEYGYRGGELLVTATPTSQPSVALVNLAQGKPATQISTLTNYNPSGDAWRAVDGSTNGNYMAGSVTHTNGGGVPWWEVDLGAVQDISSLDVWNRTDCCSDRLSNFYVFVSDVPFTSTDPAQTQAQAGVWTSYHSGQGATQTTLQVGRTGRYVRVQLSTANAVLSLAEVQVWGTRNLSVGQVTTQSSTFTGVTPNGNSWRAADGNINGSYFAGSVSHTNGESQPWWQVDLGAVKALNRIEVWNRTDCCSENLTDFYVLVSDAPFSSTDLSTTLNQAGVSAYHVTGQGGRPTTVQADRTGRYVRVQLAGASALELAEVQVWGADSMATPQGGDVRWLVADQLGTPRMAMDKTGSLAKMTRHDYLPFGEELYAGYGGRTTTQGYSRYDGNRQHFTGHERDDETGLDYAQARYYASAQGRFTGVDPVNGMAANPQSWNGYAYTMNNPVNLTDPTGMFANAEYSGPSWEVEGYGDMWKRRALWTDDIERAMARYQEMVDQGAANLAQRRKKKREQPQQQQQRQAQQAQPALTATASEPRVTFVMNYPLDPNDPNTLYFTGFGAVQVITVLQDGKPVVGATGTEIVTGGTEELPLIQRTTPFTTNERGEILDLVSTGQYTSEPVSTKEALRIYRRDSTATYDETTRQTITLNLPGGGGSAELSYKRRLTNLDADGKLKPPEAPAVNGPTNFTISNVTPVTVKRRQ